MTYEIERELARFEAWGKGDFPAHRLERLCDFGWLLIPKAQKDKGAGGATLPPGKDIALTLLGLTHGNELAGVAVLNSVLALLAAGAVSAPLPIAFILGNPWAAGQNRRFLERDLNRSFARPGAADATAEERRARALEAPLARTAFIIDFHQTMRRSERPFFIFPYTPSSFAWARRIGPRLSVVTHWGKPFSAEGRCSDEFVNAAGGVGVSIELGQNGFDPYQIAVGTELALWSLQTVAADFGAATLPRRVEEPEHGEIFTWAEIVPWPSTGLVELRSDWHNFKPVQAGELLGTVDGKPLTAAAAGRMLFPKYLSHAEQQALSSRPTELCRIMKSIQASELPA